jgi:TetR/AcrR family transcriptional regulator, fatty acid metabolism regulator protein
MPRTDSNRLEPPRTPSNALEPPRTPSNLVEGSKREAILRAAVEVFARRGYFGAQVADIARAAGVAAGTVYLYFRSKDDLLVSIFDATMKEAREEGRAALQGIASPVERLRRIAELHLDRLGRDRNLAVVFQVELRQSTKFMERFSTSDLRDYLGIIRDTIAQGQESGAFRSEISPTLAAKVFFGALDELATNWILSNRKYALAADADAIVDLFVNGVGKKKTRAGARGQGPGARGAGARA